MKKTKLKIYYVVIIVVILCGFFVGSKETIENHGYTYYYGEDRGTIGNYWHLGRASEEIGDLTKTKIIGWYIIPLKTSHKYFAGNLELNYDVIKKAMPIEEMRQLGNDDFNYIYYLNLIWFLIICIILIAIPFGITFFTKYRKKKTGKKKIRKIKDLAEMKELGIISEEEYEAKKKQKGTNHF